MSERRPTPDASAPTRDWIEGLIAAHRDEVEAREITVRIELDPRFQIAREGPLESAMVDLFRFAFSTIPDRCELFVATAREIVPVSALDSGSLTLRWQAVGAASLRDRGSVTAIRPIAGGAQVHVESRAAQLLLSAFDAASWNLELIAVNGDQEIWAQVGTRSMKPMTRPS